MTAPAVENLFFRMIKGDIALWKAYWLFGVVGNIAWKIVLSIAPMTPGSATTIALVILWVAYFTLTNTMIWNSASKYKGERIRAILAKLAAAAGFCLILFVSFQYIRPSL